MGSAGYPGAPRVSGPREGFLPPPPGRRPQAAPGTPQPQRGAPIPSGAQSTGQRPAPQWAGLQDGGSHQGGGAAASTMSAQDFGQAAQKALDDAGNRVIDTSSGKADGLDKCPKCGSTDIHYSITAKALVCGYCRNQWNEDVAEQAFGLDSAIEELRGHTLASGTGDIREDLTTVTLKCQGCGAEVVIRVDEQLQSRCHWCRQTLSINTQIPNGAVPDAVLPFQLTREQAIDRINEFVGSRRAFAHARFKSEFVPDNVMGVYIPYMVVDGNLHAVLQGTGEVTTRQYTVRRKVGDNYVSETYYDADVYDVRRAFDLLVDDLTVESSSRYDARDNTRSTNNILNAVQPYDTAAAVAYNSNYLRGFTSERRDLNIRDVDDSVEEKFLSIARAKARPTISRYDRGVRWEHEGVAVHGTRWVAVYVPVWLYSYADSAKGGGSLVHYIAVNGRNGNTMGSVPVSHPKIFALSCFLGTIATAIAAAIGWGWFFLG
ncbi:TFIIB-type zinc ribbon-containing protein [Brachybacterium muris]|uniref:TFIIB-type zinc ribbon-containing protein n=1 Tax=Brachybacterium muris TaxID=219301 RepID=UPI00223A7CE8|nr:TFIIB-type zinc ribbon-containing protein [Brachybacterium muris]MCT2262412.1 TFIIB-type zinc ribbon-containing protein [Brachybacterium muris]MCT2294860.1 TFIIB-type zinc ribbon-containing protein [Brachybacterium muris]